MADQQPAQWEHRGKQQEVEQMTAVGNLAGEHAAVHHQALVDGEDLHFLHLAHHQRLLPLLVSLLHSATTHLLQAMPLLGILVKLGCA